MKDSTPAHSMSASPEEQALFAEKLRFLMHECPVFACQTPTREVLEKMRQSRSGGVLLCEGGDTRRLAGIFTERDYLDKISGDVALEAEPIERFMTSSPAVLSPEDSVGKAVRLMTEGGYRHVPLVDEEKRITGMVSCRNIVDFISEHFPEEVYNHPPVLHQRITTQEGG